VDNSNTYTSLSEFFRELLKDTVQTVWVLLKIMVPVSIVVKIIQETGLLTYIGQGLAPLMTLVGLPGEMGLVWGTGILTNLYGGVLAFVNIAPALHMTTAQITVITIMMLTAHTFAIELSVARKSGVRLFTMLVFRFAFGLIMGFIVYAFYSITGLCQEQGAILWNPPAAIQNNLSAWALGQMKNFGVIAMIIFSLLLLIKLLKLAGVIRWLTHILTPVLKVLGTGKETVTVMITGLLLGVVYGGALIIKESKTGLIGKRDIFYAFILMGLCHSLIEDTFLMLALGGHYSGVFFLRIILAFIFTMLIVKLTRNWSDRNFNKWLIKEQPYPN
jgi:hypothetical protein